MDDGKVEVGVIDVSEENAKQKEVEMDFNTMVLNTAEGLVYMYFSSWRSFYTCSICLDMVPSKLLHLVAVVSKHITQLII